MSSPSQEFEGLAEHNQFDSAALVLFFFFLIVVINLLMLKVETIFVCSLALRLQWILFHQKMLTSVLR
jgi:hypothetical protein